MEVTLYKRLVNGNMYLIRDSDGHIIGQVDWIMAGPNVGQHFYSHDSRYKPPKIRKIFRHETTPHFQMNF